MKLKLNANLKGNKAGTVIEVADNNGIPLDNFWARRLKDSAIDNCVEIVKDKKYSKKEKD